MPVVDIVDSKTPCPDPPLFLLVPVDPHIEPVIGRFPVGILAFKILNLIVVIGRVWIVGPFIEIVVIWSVPGDCQGARLPGTVDPCGTDIGTIADPLHHHHRNIMAPVIGVGIDFTIIKIIKLHLRL